MVKLHPISTPNNNNEINKHINNNNKNNTTSSSSSSESSSPTSALPEPIPQSEMTKMPPLLLPHHHYHPHYSPPPPPPPHHPTTIIIFQSYPPPFSYYPNPVYFYPGQLLLPPPPPPQPTPYLIPQTTPGAASVGPTTVGPRVRFEKRRVDHPRRGKAGPSLGPTTTTTTRINEVWKPKESNKKNEKMKKKMENPKSGAELAQCTTVMLRNIPNTLSRNNLIALLDRHCREQNGNKHGIGNPSFESQYDFVYLPFDFLRGQNLGYAFINFTTVEGASNLYTRWNDMGWECCQKIRAITPAKLQGLAQCRHHFESSVFICESMKFLPLEFSPPRNGFNGDACKAKTIGRWVYNGECPRRSSSNNNWWVKTVHPPRLKHNSSKR